MTEEIIELLHVARQERKHVGRINAFSSAEPPSRSRFRFHFHFYFHDHQIVLQFSSVLISYVQSCRDYVYIVSSTILCRQGICRWFATRLN